MTHWLSGLDDPVRTLGFSADARRLVTAGDSPEARLWDLAAAPGELKTPEVTFQDPGISRNVTCVAIRPGTEQVVTGHSDGKVYLLDPEARASPSGGHHPWSRTSSAARSRRSRSLAGGGTWRRPARAPASGSDRSRSNPGCSRASTRCDPTTSSGSTACSPGTTRAS